MTIGSAHCLRNPVWCGISWNGNQHNEWVYFHHNKFMKFLFFKALIWATYFDVWLVTFTATLYNKIFPGYRPCQLVKWRKNQRFKDHLCPRLQGTDVSGESVRVRYRPGTQAGLYLTRTDSSDTSVPWRRGQRWSLKHWFLCRLTNWHG
jgi:hypothetical protein